MTYVPVMNRIAAIILCRRAEGNDVSDIETIPSPWTPVRKEKSVSVQTEDITSDKGDTEVTVHVNCDTESNDDNKCDDFRCDRVSVGNINENIGNMNENDIVLQDIGSECSMGDNCEDNITIDNMKLSDNAEDVSNCLKYSY